MGTITYSPSDGYSLPGMVAPTIFGGSPDIETALDDASDATGVHFGTTITGAPYHGFYVVYSADSVLPPTGRIDWIRVDYRARHVQPYSFMWPATLAAFIKGTDNPRTKHLPITRIPSDAAVQETSSIASRTSDEGTPWNDCETFHVIWGRFGPGDDQQAWDATNYPYLTETWLTAHYTVQPLVTDIVPDGTIGDPTPLVTWAVDRVDDVLPTSYRVMVFDGTEEDAGGRTHFDIGFEPETVTNPVYDSGRTYGTQTQHQVSSVLPADTLYVYIKQWIGSGADEYGSQWNYEDFLLDPLTVDLPTITLTDDVATNTVRVELNPGPVTEDLVADTIEVQYFDGAYWLPAPIPDSEVDGTGTSVFYDGLHAPGDVVTYRARGKATSGGDPYASTWVSSGPHTVANAEEWWLRSTSDYSLNRSLNDSDGLLMCDWSISRQRPNVATWGIGARPATMVHDVTKGDVHDCQVWAFNQTAYLDLRALLEDGDDLMLVNPWGEAWRVQVGGEVTESVVRSSPRVGETTPLGFVRQVSFSLIEVVVP